MIISYYNFRIYIELEYEIKQRVYSPECTQQTV